MTVKQLPALAPKDVDPELWQAVRSLIDQVNRLPLPINDQTEKATPVASDNLLLQQSDGTYRRTPAA